MASLQIFVGPVNKRVGQKISFHAVNFRNRTYADCEREKGKLALFSWMVHRLH